MLSRNPFIKAPMDYTYNAKMPASPIYTGKDEAMKVRQAMMQESKRKQEEQSGITAPKYIPGMSFGDMIRQAGHNNTATRHIMGDPKFGFKTMLSGESKPLPTAPAVVGGNVDWSQRVVNPYTGFLHGEIAKVRPMMPLPAMGTKMFMKEPNVNSIHTNL